jgi:hypothetical protein
MATGTIKVNKWSAETEVEIAAGKFWFSKSNNGLLTKCRFKLSSEGSSEAIYNSLIPSDYIPRDTFAFVGYDNNGAIRGGIMYSNRNLVINASPSAGFYGQVIY